MMTLKIVNNFGYVQLQFRSCKFQYWTKIWKATTTFLL